MKIGMIGIGDIARKAYLPILSATKGIELHVCTRNAETLRDLTATYKIDQIYQHIDDLLASGIQAAFVHSATDSHEVIIDTLLDHNIHVYVDKPITYHAESSQRLLEKAKEKGLLLMVGFNRRYAPPYQQLKEITEPNMVIMQKNRGHHPDDPRTFIFDDFIHVIDTLLNLFPYPIENYYVKGKQVDGELYHVILQLEAKEGSAIGVMNRDAGTTEENVKVIGSEETRTVTNIKEITTNKDKSVFIHGSDDWEPMLHQRGFHGVIMAFIEKVRHQSILDIDYEQDLERHLLAEKVVQALAKM